LIEISQQRWHNIAFRIGAAPQHVREGGVCWKMIGSIVGTKEREDMHAATKGGMKT